MDLKDVKNAQNGDKEAFETIIMELIDYMYRIAYGILRNEDDASDAVSNATLKAYEKIKTLKQFEFFKTWITRILINECNHIYKQKKKVIYIEKYNQILKDTYSNYNSDISIDVQNAMSKLDEDLKQIVILYYFEDLGINEITNILEIPTGTVKSRLSRARQVLAKQLIDGYDKKSM